ncbi:hypothetical protein NL529_33600, partial [Klebsiella pneumoniae]|nr:hypothetical protein [Klebsiella pneumoniae]
PTRNEAKVEPIEKRKHRSDFTIPSERNNKTDSEIKPPSRVDWPQYKSYIHEEEIKKSADDETRIVTVRNPRDEHPRYNR